MSKSDTGGRYTMCIFWLLLPEIGVGGSTFPSVRIRDINHQWKLRDDQLTVFTCNALNWTGH